jgi:hemerythrin-like domain-containing protein
VLLAFPRGYAAPKAAKEPEVSAVEDLMREHGVLRRVLAVYREAASRLRSQPAQRPSPLPLDVPPDALAKAAKLLRDFVEDYHEKKLEEAHLFPAVQRAGGEAARDVGILIVQHERGREITDYVISVAAGSIAQGRAEVLARALESYARMYEEHAAREDTLVFPAWKKTLPARRLSEMGELFEDIEHKTFGKDGFDDAVEKIGSIERAFGLELAKFTAPAPR